jgi:hypothetical protein
MKPWRMLETSICNIMGFSASLKRQKNFIGRNRRAKIKSFHELRESNGLRVYVFRDLYNIGI